MAITTATVTAVEPAGEPARDVHSATPPPTATGAAPLAVKANAPIAALRVGARGVPVGRPTRDLEVPLEPAEREKGGSIDAVAADGREARVAFGAGAAVIKIDFPVPRPAPASPPVGGAAPTRSKPAPLAPDPYPR
jgi:hypothetical protein